MVRDILLHTDPILRKQCEAVSDIDESLRQLADDMIETMYAAPGLGLAANQIGESKRVFVLDALQNNNPKVFVNPEILNLDDITDFQEGCLSIPGAVVWNRRYNKVRLSWTDLYNNKHEEDFEGIEAIAIQHEMDHLNGKLFIDDFGPLKKQMALKKSQKYLKLLKRSRR